MGQIHKGVSLKHSHETGYLKNYIYGEKWVKFTLKLCKPTYEKIWFSKSVYHTQDLML